MHQLGARGNMRFMGCVYISWVHKEEEVIRAELPRPLRDVQMLRQVLRIVFLCTAEAQPAPCFGSSLFRWQQLQRIGGSNIGREEAKRKLVPERRHGKLYPCLCPIKARRKHMPMLVGI